MPTPPSPPRSITNNLIVAALVLVALAALVTAGMLANTGTDGPVSVSAVERFIPTEGSVVIRQARVGIDLAPGFTGVLIVDGVEIPEDQLDRVEALNEIYFAPREGTEIEAFEPGPLCMSALYWPVGADRSVARSTSWCFTVA